jgi:hypothetical protein
MHAKTRLRGSIKRRDRIRFIEVLDNVSKALRLIVGALKNYILYKLLTTKIIAL